MIWIVTGLAIISLFAIDLGLTRHKEARLPIVDALLQTGFWISIAFAFGFYVYFAFEYNLLADFLKTDRLTGREAVGQYMSVYFIERILSFDNLFMMTVIFAGLAIPTAWQYRILFIGLFFAIFLRWLFLIIGINLLKSHAWLYYVFGIILLFGVFKIIAHLHDAENRKMPAIVLSLIKYLPVDTKNKEARFFSRVNGKWMVTPLFIVLITIEYSDLVLATDSIPAILTISNNKFILVSGTLLALAGMRALYFVFANALQQLRYMKIAILLILSFLAFKAFSFQFLNISTMLTLLVISLITIIGVVSSLYHQDRGELPGLPMLENFARVYHLTYKSFRRIIITLIGVSVLIVGIIMIVTPGPAIIVIPVGLAILATEFVWARALLKKVKNKFVQVGKESKEFLNKRKND